jgi:hypothetical protein
VPRLQAKGFSTPFEPGCRWLQAMDPVFGLTSCPTRHLGCTVSGSVRVVMDDGQVLDRAASKQGS